MNPRNPPPAPREERRDTNLLVILHVGLQEVMQRCYSYGPPASNRVLATSAGRRATPRSPEYRRLVRVANVSASGLGIEADDCDCVDIAQGDLVALRLDPEGHPELGMVVRTLPAPTPGMTWIGIRRLSSCARPIEIAEPEAHAGGALIFMPGLDEAGRYDGCLIEQSTYEAGIPVTAHVGGSLYDFEFGNVRLRGRGWVLAAFEIAATAPCLPPPPAARAIACAARR